MAERSRGDLDPAQRAPLDALRERLGVDGELPHLVEAVTHPSFANEQRDGYVDNQRLEFLGDAVLGLCVSEQLMEVFTGVDEGQLTVMRASLVNGDALAVAARQLDVGEALRLGRGAATAGERDRTNVLADALEALVGAVFLDRGLGAARKLSRRLLGDAVARLVADGGIERDAKSRLQELAQAHGLDPPTYDVVAVEGPHHARRFTMRVRVDMIPLGLSVPVSGDGEGRSKKLAEQAAASAALVLLRDALG